MMDLWDYLNSRRDRVREHYSWLTDYIKKIEPSPNIDQIVLLCDNFANELTILNNEVNYRLETALKLQDKKIKELTMKIDEIHATQTDLEDIKKQQKKLSEFQESLENAARAKAEQLDNDIKKSEDDLKRRFPGVG
jgi:hypothetical protein